MRFHHHFILFSRPHTIVGTTLSISALYIIAVSLSRQHWVEHLGLLALALLSCLGANIFIVGLNQIADVEIDRINKPYLPLASGAFSPRMAYVLIFAALALAMGLAVWIGGYLLLAVVLSLVLGIAYSLPPVRLKRFHFWAAFCIIAVRGLIVNVFLFLHFQDHIGQASGIPSLIWLLTAAIFIYSIAIAWFKDLPDTEGDQAYRIHTLTLRLGAARVFQLGNTLIQALFITLIAAPWLLPLPVNALFFSLAHAALLGLRWRAGRRVRLSDKKAIARYYQFIWALFFMEYLIFACAAYIA
jgi:homogentisate phytyltransferase/homogentisate geranylgeranyltransferase